VPDVNRELSVWLEDDSEITRLRKLCRVLQKSIDLLRRAQEERGVVSDSIASGRRGPSTGWPLEFGFQWWSKTTEAREAAASDYIDAIEV
jgi:hypothetical protein